MTEKPEALTGDFAADFTALRRDVAHLAETIGDLVRDRTGAAGIRVSEAVGEAGEKIARGTACARNGIRQARGEVEDRIERNPWASVLIALAVGASIGLVSGPRR